LGKQNELFPSAPDITPGIIRKVRGKQKFKIGSWWTPQLL